MNDDRPIEKLLHRYARKRRDDAGPPLELHPATRRLLQGEVARQYRKDAPESTRSSFAQSFKAWLPRLVWTLPLFIIVAIGAWALLDRPETKQVALGTAPTETTGDNVSQAAKAGSLDSSSERRSAAEPQPASRNVRRDTALTVPAAPERQAKNSATEQALAAGAGANQPVVSLADAASPASAVARDAYKELQRAEEKLDVAVAAAPGRARFAEAADANQKKLAVNTTPSFDANRVTTPTTIPAPMSSATPRPDGNQTKISATRNSELPATLSETATTPASATNRDKLERDQAQTYAQSFANQVTAAFKQKTEKIIAPAPLSPVLANFRVEQTGRQLRVVDGDGSTYLGETDSIPLGGAGVGGKKEQVGQLFKSDGKLNQLPGAAVSSLQPQGQNNFYRVAGTNRTLNQAVVFTWSFVEMTNAPFIAASGKIGDELKKDAKKLPTQFPVQLQNSFISGRAQFETGQEIEINAVPVAR